MWVSAILAVQCGLLVASGPSSVPPIAYRWASASIVPPEQLPLGGYTERHGASSIPGGDDLQARVLVFQRGEQRIALASVEMLTVPESLAREVKARLPKDVRLFLTATHTHCAPDSQMLNERMNFAIPGIATFKRRWLDWYAERIASTVNAALGADRKPIGSLLAHYAHLDLSRTRRKDARADQLATVVTSGTEKGTALLINYAAHPVNYDPIELHLRSDWPGATMRSVGGIVLNGALGDVSPHAPGTTPEQRVDAFVQAFRTMAQAPVPRETVCGSNGKLGWSEEPIELAKPRPHPTFAKANGVPESLAKILVDKFAPPEARIVAFRLGSLAVVGVPGEPTAELGRQIRLAGMNAGFRCVLIASHTNGWIGYLLSASDYARGGYEATLSFYGPGGGNLVVAAAQKALRRLASAGATAGTSALGQR